MYIYIYIHIYIHIYIYIYWEREGYRDIDIRITRTLPYITRRILRCNIFSIHVLEFFHWIPSSDIGFPLDVSFLGGEVWKIHHYVAHDSELCCISIAPKKVVLKPWYSQSVPTKWICKPWYTYQVDINWHRSTTENYIYKCEKKKQWK